MKFHFPEKYKNLSVQVRASIWFLICSFLQKGISMITTPIFTRLMSTDEYGQYGVYSSWLGIVTILVCLNLYAGVHEQGLVKFSNERKTFNSSLQGLSFVLFLSWVVIYSLFSSFFNELLSLSTKQVFLMLITIWTTSVFCFWANEQRVQFKYRALVVLTLAVSIAKPVLEIVLMHNSNDKVTARIFGSTAIQIIAYSWIFIIQLKRGKRFFSSCFWKYAILFNLPLIPHYLSQTILNSADRIMIERMVGESEAGIYNLAYSISMIMTLFNTALSQTLSPWIYGKIKEEKETDLSSIAYLTLGIIAIVNLLLILFAPEVIQLFAPADYYEAIWIIPPVAMSAYFMFAYDLFAKFAFYYEKTKLIMLATAFGALLNLVLNYIFIQIYGYIAAGYTTLVCFIVYALIHYYIMMKIIKEKCNSRYPYNSRKLIAITVVFMIFGFTLLMTYSNSVIRYAIGVIVIILIVLFRNRIKELINKLFKIRKAV